MSDHDHVIVYDNNDDVGMFSAARLWWMFKVSGLTPEANTLLLFIVLYKWNINT